jgi:hypothetical protein
MYTGLRMEVNAFLLAFLVVGVFWGLVLLLVVFFDADTRIKLRDRVSKVWNWSAPLPTPSSIRYWRRDRLWRKMERGELGEKTDELLRATHAPEAEPERLLRAASTGTVDPDELLRHADATEGDRPTV